MKLDKNKIMAIFITVAAFLVLGGIAYAFFSASVSNDNNEKFQTETATMRLVFSDNDNGVSGTLNLGESIVKKFTLENTGTVEAYAKINWVDLINTYLPGSLTYNLEQSTSENGTYTSIKTGNVPVSSSATTMVLKNGILVPVNTMYYYKLTITLNNLENVNQNSDITANFHSYFNLQEGSLSGADTIQNLVAGEPTNTTNVITKTAPSGATCTNTLAYDGTTDNNLRYVGANPCNYVTFNGESPNTGEKWAIVQTSDGAVMEVYETQSACQTRYTEVGSPSGFECQSKTMTTGGWRIVGVMNNVDDGTGKLETRIKIVRNEPLGNYSWDTSASNINSGYGINDWTQADLKNELNGDYLNTSLNANTTWYNGYNNQKTAEYDYTMGLSAAAQGLIGDTKWYLGGMELTNADLDLIPSTMYTLERGTKVWGSTSGQTCNDGYCPRALFWTGKVALIYPSDYGYATAGGTTTNRSTCIGTLSTYYNQSGETWMNNNYSDCKDNNWIPYGWALSPSSYNSGNAMDVNTGTVSGTSADNADPARPAVYLKSEISISGGNGSESEPYLLA